MLDKINLLRSTTGKGLVFRPDGNAREAAIKLWAMSKWLYDEFKKDTEEINAKNINPMANPEVLKDKDLEDLSLRCHCRFLSYSILICSVDKILNKMYADLSTVLNLQRDQTQVNNRGSEIHDLKIWRDKVAAHTSYADPRDDNEALQLTTLIQFGSMSWQINPVDFSKMVFGGTNLYLDGQAPNISLPQIQWEGTHQKMKEHYQQWVDMFNTLTSKL